MGDCKCICQLLNSDYNVQFQCGMGELFGSGRGNNFCGYKYYVWLDELYCKVWFF